MMFSKGIAVAESNPKLDLNKKQPSLKTASALLENQNYEEAISCCQKLLTKNPRNYKAMQVMARAYEAIFLDKLTMTTDEQRMVDALLGGTITETPEHLAKMAQREFKPEYFNEAVKYASRVLLETKGRKKYSWDRLDALRLLTGIYEQAYDFTKKQEHLKQRNYYGRMLYSIELELEKKGIIKSTVDYEQKLEELNNAPN